MVRPREFDRDEALGCALRVFWAKGYASTSTEDLLAAMNIGRQSLYNAFGDKRKLYLEALERYQGESTAGHIERLNGSASPLAGIEALLLGLVADDEDERALGCMGVVAMSEFGAADPELVALRNKVAPRLSKRLLERIREGQAGGEIDTSLDARQAAAFLLMTMQGIQLAARGGSDAKSLRALARFAIERFRAR
ncbi:TetR/AcrR family transcriptional regulator [Paraburkholderia guartelaensis]|uniref:TetR/AcrR family transcriptional regulator n=1 Tax=Paraburkholderia guartelaensis TaxID=2546446 RepID=A0A4R5L2H2_9BURK|nr:TetR/AcrR family transcriptional regulator [Paraburkholderia guartelaensis]TDG02573.1 TetR/AcrR family transcriptional regulator [Paraburkholderia guartelaensis]